MRNIRRAVSRVRLATRDASTLAHARRAEHLGTIKVKESHNERGRLAAYLKHVRKSPQLKARLKSLGKTKMYHQLDGQHKK